MAETVREPTLRYGFVIDQDTCIGCHACTVACKTEHRVPLGVNRTWVKYVEKGRWPDTRRFFTVMRCNHCTNAPCVAICPTRALYRRRDGIVDFDTSRCIGCKACMQACPYDALYIDPGDNTAQKCNYCAHRVEVGIEPACVVVCPEQAIISGDLDDPASKIARLVAGEQVFVRSPEQGTRPNLFYKGAEQASLDPALAEVRAGSMIWRDAPDPLPAWTTVDLTPSAGVSGHTGSDGLPRVVYTTDHPPAWGWRIAAYFLTKGISAGLVLAAALAIVMGAPVTSAWARWVTPLLAGVFLGLTGVLLVWDLKRPDRFTYVLTKPNPGSWLVRGAWILGAFGLVLAVWFVAGVADAGGLVRTMTWIGVPLAAATAGYTAFLFGQAEGRDLWQSPMLLWHMLAGAFAAGGGAAVALTWLSGADPITMRAAAWSMVGGAAVLGLVAWIEVAAHHPTRNIELATQFMTRGVFAREWWFGGQVLGVVLPVVCGAGFLAGWPPAVAGLGGVAAGAGIWFSDNAFVKAGQSVPLS